MNDDDGRPAAVATLTDEVPTAAMRVDAPAGAAGGAHRGTGVLDDPVREVAGPEAQARRELRAAQQDPRRVEDAAAELRRTVATTTMAALVQAELTLLQARRRRAGAEREAAALLERALARAGAIVAHAEQELRAAADLLGQAAPTVGAPPETLWPELPPPPPLPVPSPPGSASAVSPPARDPAASSPAIAPTVGTGAPPQVRSLVPVLSLGRELVLRLLVLAGVLTTAWFWLWWLGSGHGQWTLGSVVVTALLAWVFILPAYFCFFICRMTRPNPAVPLPECRVAMIVTKAPSEPWPVVEATLEGMVGQHYPFPYDLWLADEHPSLSTRAWCASRGVQLSTRFEVKDYHRPTWPRRTRSKEGNLAYFYDHFGYEHYDVVVQLDADHVPAPEYLAHMVRPFADPKVGYVCAPSVCDINAEQGWTVRGRLYREAAMHGPVQAGSNGGYAPVCIGSHYAVRTAALRDVGGIGPELAEDYSTTLAMQAGGWEGVFAIDAEAHGEGPGSVGEMILQELQWSRSLGALLVAYAPRRLRSVPWRARLRLGFALAFYPLQGLALALATLLPLVGILTRSSWGQTSLAGFYLHLWPCSLVALATTLYLRSCGLLRPHDAKLWSWELTMFQFLRWPWTSWGFLQGAYAAARSKLVSFKVTPKSAAELKPLRPQVLAPSLALAAVLGWTVILVPDPGAALGFMVLAATQSVAYLVVATATTVLHIAANRRRLAVVTGAPSSWPGGPAAWGLTLATGGRAALATLAVVVPTVLGLGWRFGLRWPTS